ncbi:hypothetical protein QLX67_02865 [Balneolaceae bacterium ANBcel3]|nr:hypothetical protein [Balneolaceae bacterium ANBcel3]
MQYMKGFLWLCCIVLLAWIAWTLISGAWFHLFVYISPGPLIQTAIQVLSGLLTLLVVAGARINHRYIPYLNEAWAISLAITAGLSPLVYGPRMPLIAVLFVFFFYGFARAVLWTLHWSSPFKNDKTITESIEVETRNSSE